jgi:antitoxin (DNA-binding transcriptional repressor) of toxin-antitoxin stability system
MNMMSMLIVKTISMVDLRTQSERIVRELKRGERMILSYRGEPLAELVPTALAAKKISPLEALQRAQELAAQNPDFSRQAGGYLLELRTDQKAWGERSPS